MLLNYVSIAFRNLTKYKIFSFINIIGMAISLASCMLIAIFVADELKYDQHHPNADRTYRVYNITDHQGVHAYLPIVPYPFATYLQKDFPEIESTLRVMDTYGEQLFESDSKKIMEAHGMVAEPSVFEMLTLNVISGNATKALTKPHTVALSASLAQKYFGDKNPVGQSIKINSEEFEITAVFANPPKQFHLKINYVMSYAGWISGFENNWQRQQWFTYIKLKPGTDVIAMEEKLKPFVEKYAYPTIEVLGFTYVPHLQNVKDIHLHSSSFEWEMAQRGDAQSVYILFVAALMILVIALLNFINLSTARSVNRMKEVGVRKVVGAARSQLVFQFISESVVFTLLGLFLALVIVQTALPYLNTVIDKELTLPIEPLYSIGVLSGCILLGVLAGSYPALYLSQSKPAIVLKKKQTTQQGTGVFRQSLVVIQFMLSFFLITGSWIVLDQNDLINHKNLGFAKEQLVVIPLRGSQLNNLETTKRQYSNHPNVINSTLGFGLPGDIIAGDKIVDPVTDKTFPTSLFCVDTDYISTMGMEVIAGRDFSVQIPSDSIDAFILNETAVRTFGFGTPDEAIGKRLDWDRWDIRDTRKKGKVIGVVRDFHFKSLREKLTPVVMHIYPKASWKLALRIRPENMEETIAHFKKTYESLDPDWIFTYNFLDQNFDAMYKSEQRLGKLLTVFTYLAIGVACLGLFGLVEHGVNQRAKEISIRKIFGASVPSLLALLTRRYLILLSIAFALVVPLSFFSARHWLDKFAYRIDIDWFVFAKSALVIIAITTLTISFQSIKAALSNPAQVLKND